MMFSRGAGLICEMCNKTIKHCHDGQPRSVVVLEETSHNKAIFCFQKCVRHLLSKSSVTCPRSWDFMKTGLAVFKVFKTGLDTVLRSLEEL